MMDVIAGELKMDPAEVRFRNFVRPNQFPYTNAGGYIYDSGNYPEMLKKALRLAEYEKWRQKQRNLKREGRFVGIGISSYVHGASGNQKDVEGVSIRIDPLGNVIVRSGSPDMGTSHATAICQVLAEELGVNPDEVKVLFFDSDSSPWTFYSGTRSNRFAGAELESLLLGARQLRTKVCKIAAHVLAAPLDKIDLVDGKAVILDHPERNVTISSLAKISYSDPEIISMGLTLEETSIAGGFRPDQNVVKNTQQPKDSKTPLGSLTRGYVSYPSSAHVAIVEVDIETGMIKILKYVIVHDVGRVINPMIVEGQVHGAATHGIAAALMEGFCYDEEGQQLTTTFGDYAAASALDLPDLLVGEIETPSPRSSLGVKGVGEGEALGPLPALANAVEDALSPLHIQINDLPLMPERLHKLIARSVAINGSR
jgi:CO/xanthine dehydrogenase Mo-binding subunit